MKTPALLLFAWLAAIAGSVIAPRFFAPGDGVDLAPFAGLVSLGFVGLALVFALWAAAHTLAHRGLYGAVQRSIGIAPLLISVVALSWLVVRPFG